MENNGQIEKHVVEGNLYLLSQNFAAAEGAFESALELSPQDARALCGRAQALRGLEKYAEAQTVLDAALSLYPDDFSLLTEQVGLLGIRGEAGQARAALDRALAITPESPEGRIAKISLLVALKRDDEAEELLAETLVKFPDNKQVLFVRADMYLRQQRHDEAAELLISSGGEETVSVAAEVAAARGDLGAADQLLQKALARLPESARLWQTRGQVLARRGEWAAAAEAFLKAGNENDLARVLALSGAELPPEEVAALFGRADVRFPESHLLARSRGFYLYNTKRYAEAVEYLDRAQRADADDAVVAVALISALRLSGLDNKPELLARAGTLAEEALVKFPDDPEISMEASRVFHAQGKFDRAVEVYDAILKKEPGNQGAVAAKSLTLRTQGRAGAPEKFAEAETLLRGALERAPEDRVLQNQLGWLRYDQKRHADALEVFARAGDVDGAVAFLEQLAKDVPAEEAAGLVQRAAEWFAGSAPLLTLCGALRYDARKFEEAVGYYSGALAADAKYVTAHKWKIIALCQMGSEGQQEKLDEAERAASEALKLLPDNLDILSQQGWVFYHQRRHAEAVETFLKAGDEESVRNAVSALSDRYRHEEGRKLLERALEEWPQSVALLRDLATLHHSRYRFGEALSCYEKVLAVKPDDSVAAVGRVIVLYQLEREDEAEELISELRARLRADRTFWVYLSWHYIDRRQYDEAIECCDEALRPGGQKEDDDAARQNKTSALQNKLLSLRMLGRCEGADKIEEAERLVGEVLKEEPPRAEFLYERGQLYLDRDRAAEAEKCFAQACRVSPAYMQAAYAHADALNRLDLGAKALAVFESLLKSYPEDLDVRNQLGWFHINRGDVRLAEREFRAILERDAQSVVAQNGLGGVHFELGEYDVAEEHFRRMVATVPCDPGTRANLAWALVRQGGEDNLKEAERQARRALEIDRRYAAAHGCLGVIAFKRGDLRRSEEHFLESIRVSPREGSYTDLGALYVQMGRYDEATGVLKKALEINRFDVQALIELGNLHLRTDKHKEAVRTFRHARSLNPATEETHRALAGALIRAGDLDDAERVLRAAVNTLGRRQLWRIRLLLSQLLIKRGDDTQNGRWYEEALKEADEAIALAPGQPEPYFCAGVIHYNLDDYRSAIGRFRQCIERDTKHYEAKRNLSLVQSLIKKEKTLQFGSFLGAFLLGLISIVQLVIIWVVYGQGRVSETVLIVMIPILLGLFVLSFLLPGLVRLKLPGLEAELSQPQQKETITSGPKGSVGISLPSSTSSGPR